MQMKGKKSMTALKISDENYNLLETVVLEIGKLEKTHSPHFGRLLRAFEMVEQCEHSQNQKGFDLALANLRTIYTNLTRLKIRLTA